jgi:uncharacterized protein (DUF4415 family)
MAIVRYERKPLTPEQIDRLKKVANLPDEEIDFSDIPDNDEGYDVAGRVRGLHYRPVKQQVTLRVDANVLDWFRRKTPKGYQTDINRVLSEYVAEQEKKAG